MNTNHVFSVERFEAKYFSPNSISVRMHNCTLYLLLPQKGYSSLFP